MRTLGAFAEVFTPSNLAILAVVRRLGLRLPTIVGQVGLYQAWSSSAAG